MASNILDTARELGPFIPRQPRSDDCGVMSERCRFCCKSRLRLMDVRRSLRAADFELPALTRFA